ncbi:trypsin-like serine peptidase [Dermacoccus nishinomiyaensis]|uniref:trypsin-like serine peptidase n=1 Tax=Dermacoccus nishinomiyaensis TaxID=1274 RepID=UPI0011A668F6|nr:trypsin-like peptidase domain-containing protein [Dermacoccus nishinomiyaensis]
MDQLLHLARARRALAAAGCIGALVFTAAPTAEGGRTLQAAGANPTSRTGVLIEPSDGGDEAHFCTASVVHSESKDVIMTAAHCLGGKSDDLVFVPQYSGGARPLGTWKVKAAFLDSAWMKDQDPDADVAFLSIETHGSGKNVQHIEDATGAYELEVGRSRAAGTPVSVQSYNNDSDMPTVCQTTVLDDDNDPVFHCDGYSTGSSGSPWVTTVTSKGHREQQVIGLIGGHHQGGCYTHTSYSPTFDSRDLVLLARADAGGAGDTTPTPGDDGC